MAYATESKLMACPPQNTCDSEPRRQPYVPAEVCRLHQLAKDLEETQRAVEAKLSSVLMQEQPTNAQCKDRAESSSGCVLADELSRVCSMLATIRDDFLRMIDRCEL